MQLPRDPAPLALLGRKDSVDRFTRHAFGEMNGKGGPCAERLGEAQVVIGEARIGTVLVEGGNDTDGVPVKHERDEDRRHAADAARHHLVGLGILQDRVDALAPRAREDTSMLRVGGDVVADQALDVFAVGDGDAKSSRGGGQRDEDSASIDQLAQMTGDEGEEAGHVSFLEDALGERVERLELTDPVDSSLMDPHLLDRDPRLGREQRCGSSSSSVNSPPSFSARYRSP